MSGNPLEQVGIAIAVPISWEDFRARVEHSDWLSKYFDRDLGREDLDLYLQARWETEYLPLVVKPLKNLIELGAQGGAGIYTSATLKDIRSITEEKQVAILCCHWKGPEIVYEDLLEHDGTTPFGDRLEGTAEDWAVWLRAQIRRAAASPSKLVDVLNESLKFPAKRTGEGGTIVMESSVTRRAMLREKLNALFDGLLRPGNRLELYDGLCMKEALEQAISPRFQGVLDLTLCTSTVPADYIAACRHHTLRTVQFPWQIEFVWAARVIAGTLSLFSSGNFEYQEAREVAIGVHRREVQRSLKR